VRGLDLLRAADVVVHDRLVPQELLLEAKAAAEIIDAGKRPGGPRIPQAEIHEILVARAHAGLRVVRLKGGDPFVFGRGWEELEACRRAGVPCEVVPGVSSATAVPAAAGIPVTLRGAARSFAVVTARGEDGEDPDFEGLDGADTVVILMGRSNLDAVAGRLVRSGRSPDTPAACIESGTTPGQRLAVGTLGTIAGIAREAGLEAPLTTVVGEVARCAVAGGAGRLPSLARR
jgi:uroporphyrin-III C-methyltransferase